MTLSRLLLLFIFSTTIEALNGFNSSSSKVPISSKYVPGCPDLEFFQTTDFQNTKQLTRISCLCGPGHLIGESEKDNDESVSITCIYGSTVVDLQRSINLAKETNKNISRIMLDHADFSNSSVTDQVFSLPMPYLKHLEVKKCRGSLKINVSEENIANKFDSLETIDIEECELSEIPSQLLAKTPNLKRLSLAGNKITELRKGDFVAIKMLETLNMARNMLSSSVEEGSLSKLINLVNLEIGEHNFASETLLTEIGQLTNLENLDMSQMDGIVSTEQFDAFQNMTRLKRLVLTGCNLKALNSNEFSQFVALEWLDLRINLIERLEDKCFAGLNNLQFLSLAGNFIREFPENLWRDLPELQSLDIGWNDLRKLNFSSFDGISKKLERLNLRNNEALREIATFDGMEQLRYLNMSGTLLGEIPDGVFNLSKLEELDLSSANLSSISQNVFTLPSKNSIKWLNLANNQFKTLEENFLEGMNELILLDISENKWICDEKMQKVAQKIDSMYKKAANERREFELRNNRKTLCERPFARKGISIFELLKANSSELKYDETLDALWTSTTTTNTPKTDLLFENSTIDWKAITLLIGNRAEDEHVNFSGIENEDAHKPKYDINTVKYGQKSVVKKETNSWLSGVVVTLLVIATAFCIIVVAKRKSDDGNVERQTMKRDEEDPRTQENASSHSKQKKSAAKNYAISSF